ncbi:MAG: hybrid sensor histidine kinase/response regulator [Kofleriaceae bacterium]|nr:hybrid sensor histidine kinase/response regulator [Kofleriaceae bacterium]
MTEAKPATPLSVLIVDDSENDTFFVSRALERAGFELYTKRVDTPDAMAAALHEHSWDVILADFSMPHFSGPLALEVLQKADLDIPFILVSGTVGEETAVAMMKAGASDFVLKDHLGRLAAVVARELREATIRHQRRWAEAALETLAEAGRLAVEAPDFESVVSRAAELVVPRLADWCTVYARDRRTITDAVAVACRPGVDRAALEELAHNHPPVLEATDPVFGEVLRTRQPTLLRSIEDDELVNLARDDAQLRLLSRLEPRSLIVIPQVVRERLTGVLVLASQQRCRYSEADLGIANDIGGRFALVIENARLARERDEFISTAVHEIKTPLAVIKMAVQMASELSPDQRAERLPGLLDRLDRQVNRLTRLVNEVLEVSRIDLKRLVLSRAPVHLDSLVERAVAEVQDVSAQHHIEIRRNDPVTVDADSERIEQVLTNLLVNAVRYSPGRDSIEVESRRQDGEAVVCVRDHGIGIPADKQGRMFERFYRAHVGTQYEHTSSLGVGLYVSRELVTRHGGRIGFESTEGKGSTFWFSLPILKEAPQ